MDQASYDAFRRKAQLYVAQKLASVEKLYHLDRAAGWNLDPTPDAGLFVIHDAKGTPLLRTEALEIGTFHPEESTWRWGWSNTSLSEGQRQRLRPLIELAGLTGKDVFRSDQAVRIDGQKVLTLVNTALYHLQAQGYYQARITNKDNQRLYAYLAYTQLQTIV